MTDGTTRRYNDAEVLSGVQRRRRWTTGGKRPDRRRDVSTGDERVARRPPARHRGSQIFTWRRLMAQGALTAATAGEEVVPASEYRVLELHRLLGKKAMENELLREAVSRATGPKRLLLRSTSLLRDGQ